MQGDIVWNCELIFLLKGNLSDNGVRIRMMIMLGVGLGKGDGWKCMEGYEGVGSSRVLIMFLALSASCPDVFTL